MTTVAKQQIAFTLAALLCSPLYAAVGFGFASIAQMYFRDLGSVYGLYFFPLLGMLAVIDLVAAALLAYHKKFRGAYGCLVSSLLWSLSVYTGLYFWNQNTLLKYVTNLIF